MELLLQDIAVTAVAIGALGLLVRRVSSIVRPARRKHVCGACAACDVRRPATLTVRPNSEART
jgi:hypothetical protein